MKLSDSTWKNYGEYLTFRSFLTERGDMSKSRQITQPEQLIERFIFDMKQSRPVAILLSGGMDSAVLLPFLPAGSKAYTLFPERSKVNEVDEAVRLCRYFDIAHSSYGFSDTEYFNDIKLLTLNKGMPLSPAEPLLHLGAKLAKADGFDSVVTGGGADTKWGGFQQFRCSLTPSEYVAKFQKKYLSPKEWLNTNYISINIPEDYIVDGKINHRKFLHEVGVENRAFENAMKSAGIKSHIAPFSKYHYDFDDEKNAVEPKYLIRDMYRKIYKSEAPKKFGLQKPMSVLSEFKPTTTILKKRSTESLKTQQKLLLYFLEEFHKLTSKPNDSL